MRLIVFDGDGIWTDTVTMDPAVFCKLSTRSAVLKTLIRLAALRQRHRRRHYQEISTTRMDAPRHSEVEQFRWHLVNLFRAAANERLFGPLPGAPRLLARLERSAEFQITLATGGCWAQKRASHRDMTRLVELRPAID